MIRPLRGRPRATELRATWLPGVLFAFHLSRFVGRNGAFAVWVILALSFCARIRSDRVLVFRFRGLVVYHWIPGIVLFRGRRNDLGRPSVRGRNSAAENPNNARPAMASPRSASPPPFSKMPAGIPRSPRAGSPRRRSPRSMSPRQMSRGGSPSLTPRNRSSSPTARKIRLRTSSRLLCAAAR